MKGFLNVDDAARRAGISRAWLYILVARGEFPAPYRPSRRRSWWLPGEVDAWVRAKIAQRPHLKEVR